MEKDIILKVENVSKQYRLGQIGTGTLSHDLNRWWHKVRGKEDPYLTIGDTNDRSTKGTSDYVWALQNIDFDVERGEVLGIIGKNGAGKSTLLKILSKVTAPSGGTIKSRGRIASLLEVGTGFHSEMTGRENIYLNGAILGMTKNEITSKLDEIIEFSGCERYIDTPVKRYSSGMTVRLAFAVAAFLEPEILVVDEVLAVGDAEFQKKAIGKMKDIAKGEGRTVLFVSHNMAAVKSLCTRAILIDKGKFVFSGSPEETIDEYLKVEKRNNILEKTWTFETAPGDQLSKLISVKARTNQKSIFINQDLVLEFMIENFDTITRNLNISLVLYSSAEVPVFNVVSDSYACGNGQFCITTTIPANLMNTDTYSIRVLLVEDTSKPLCNEYNVLEISFLEEKRDVSWYGKWIGTVRPQAMMNWNIKKC
ncbi:ABC transporter ATP-binding protein [Flavobacterium salmonis]|uniref:Vitamin B12 import ATP-binding protein BtuD n=1 Tax=Flavobacterium salmonis TaxID=2654844 RepID=A0A6V6Z9P4_9FLAO|nr:ABC transporter ATP-binding protein [Flavobacterium salmonis]CAD0008498.1 Vitamin B12 import ATP-binding protein BtuD [Flavobacterium salmonis]